METKFYFLYALFSYATLQYLEAVVLPFPSATYTTRTINGHL